MDAYRELEEASGPPVVGSTLRATWMILSTVRN